MKKKIRRGVMHVFLITVGIVLIYPLVWMFFATFKTNAEIFGSSALLPTHISLNAYIEGWKSGGGVYSMGHFMKNTFLLVVPSVLLTVISSTLVGYGFARFDFPFKGFLFAMMLSTLMLPGTVTMIPKYLIFNKMGWLNTYLPFIVPAALGSSAFLIYMVLQFIRGIPTELDESAKLDGCGSLRILIYLIVPLAKPALVSCVIFQSLWSWNDYFNPLIYINSTKKFPISLGLRLMLDSAGKNAWDQIMAMSVVAILPCLILFAIAQKTFVEGVSTAGLKG